MTALAPTLQAFFVSRLGRRTRCQPAHRRFLSSRLPAASGLRRGADRQGAHRDGPRGSRCRARERLSRSPGGRTEEAPSPPATPASQRSTPSSASPPTATPSMPQTIRQVLAIPRKKTERAPGPSSPAPRWTPSSPRPTSPPGVAVVTTYCWSWRCGRAFASPSSPGCDAGTSSSAAAAHLKCLGKGRKRRDTPLDKPTVALLRSWLGERRGEPDDALFPSRRGGRLSPDAVQRLVTKHVTTAQATCPSLANKQVSTHNLRHSCAMDLLRNGLDVAVAGDLAGPRETRVRQRLHPG